MHKLSPSFFLPSPLPVLSTNSPVSTAQPITTMPFYNHSQGICRFDYPTWFRCWCHWHGHYSPLPCCQILPRFQFEIPPIFPKPLQYGAEALKGSCPTPDHPPLASKSPLGSHWEPLMVSRREPLPPVLLLASDYPLWILLSPVLQ